jgi:hypothetical protein
VRDQLVLRERARETRPDVDLPLDVIRPASSPESFVQTFERRVRELASRAVAHIKRGDGAVVTTLLGDRVRGDRNVGADPILRFLALVEPVDEVEVAGVRAERAARTSALRRPAEETAAELIALMDARGEGKPAGGARNDRPSGSHEKAAPLVMREARPANDGADPARPRRPAASDDGAPSSAAGSKRGSRA